MPIADDPRKADGIRYGRPESAVFNAAMFFAFVVGPTVLCVAAVGFRILRGL